MTVVSVAATPPRERPPRGSQGSLKVSEMRKLIDDHLDEFGRHKVRGYVTDFQHRESGPSFFNLNDNGDMISVLVPQHLAKKYTKIKGGVLVDVTGELILKKGKSQLQLNARHINVLGRSLPPPAWHSELKELGRSQRNLILGAVPNPVVIVGPAGDGVDDIASILMREKTPVNLNRINIKSCPEGIVKGINDAICSGAELIILARGGGSNITWPYNDEKVVRAVAGSPVPVITAIGHANDHTVVDEVAKKSLKTPTDAAYFITNLFDGKLDLASLAPRIIPTDKPTVQEKTVFAGRTAVKVQGEVAFTGNAIIQANEAVHISAALSNMDVTNTPKSYLGRKMRHIFSWIRSLRFGSKTVCPMSRDGDS